MDAGTDRRADPAPPTIARRVVRAAIRALPAVLIAAAIWVWFDRARRDCDARVRAWSQELTAALRRGETALPAPATVSEWVEPTLRSWMPGAGETPGAAREVRFVPADPQVDSRAPAVEWTDAGGGVVRLRCRCAGESIEIVGVERR